MLRFYKLIGACGAALIAAASLGVQAQAQSPQPGTPSAVSGSAVGAAKTPAKNKWANKKTVSPYARAASQHAHAGKAPLGHAPTMVQSMGKPRKPHTGAPNK